MSNVIFTHDASVSAFDTASGAVSTDDGVSFNWDEQHIVHVDAPSDLEGAFDTTRFYKIEDATLARPIKQRYMQDGELVTYKKPAEELRKAAWSFDNAPFTLDHPSTGMVKDVHDVHGFFRNVHYTSDDRLDADLYIPANDEEARQFVEENTDLSIGFFNRVAEQYDGDTGGLTDDDVDGFQTDLYGNHVAGVETGRCSAAEGCGLDSHEHGEVVAFTDATIESPRTEGDEVVMQMDATTTFEGPDDMQEQYSEGDRVVWSADAVVAHNPDDEEGIMIEILDKNGNSTEMVTTVDEEDLMHMNRMSVRDSEHGDAPSGIYVAEDGTWLAVGPDEHPDENTDHPDDGKFVVDTCADVEDAWGLRGSGDIDITEETLANRIQRAAEAMSCDMDFEEDADTTDTQDTNMTDDGNTFDIPDLSIDKLAAENDAVAALRDERNELSEDIDEAEQTIESAIDEAENFSVALDDEECVCDAAADLISDLDEKVAKVERLEDELEEYRAEEKEEALDRLEDLGADREDYEEDSLDALEDEIDRREEVLDAAPETTVKDIEESEDSGGDGDPTSSGPRSFGRGYSA